MAETLGHVAETAGHDQPKSPVTFRRNPRSRSRKDRSRSPEIRIEQAGVDLRGWLSWARRCRLEPFKTLATTIKDRFESVVRGMTDHRSNAYVEAMNGLLQQAKRAARGFRTSKNFIAIAYLRLSKLTHLPAHPFVAALAK